MNTIKLLTDANLWVDKHRDRTHITIDRDHLVDRALWSTDGADPTASWTADLEAAILAVTDVAAGAIWVRGSSAAVDSGPGPRYPDIHVPPEFTDQAIAAMTAAEVDKDPAPLLALAEQLRVPFDEWLAPGVRILRRGHDFPCGADHFAVVLRGEARRRRLKANATVLPDKTVRVRPACARCGKPTDTDTHQRMCEKGPSR